MEGARRAFLAGISLGRGGGEKQVVGSEVLRKISQEIDYLSNDDYCIRCVREIGVDDAKRELLIREFAKMLMSKGDTHTTLQLARQHFINWCNIMKNKVDGTDKQQSTYEWQRDLIDRLHRLSGGNTSRT